MPPNFKLMNFIEFMKSKKERDKPKNWKAVYCKTRSRTIVNHRNIMKPL